MSNRRLAAGALVLGGLLILLVSLLANVLGQLSVAVRLGIGQDPGFGSEQTLGTIVGLVGLVVGVWLWRQGAEAKFGTARFVIAALAFLAVIGGPIFVVANRSLRQSTVVEVCVEVDSVPRSAGGAGQRRVNYGVRIANPGKSRVYVDSVVLMAFRDSAGSWLTQSEVVAIDDTVVWQQGKQVDSVTVRPRVPGTWSGRWLLSTGNESRFMRSVIVPVEQLSPLYWFRGIVFLRLLDPGLRIFRTSAVNWIDNFRQECP
jgi:hypothetical protein